MRREGGVYKGCSNLHCTRFDYLKPVGPSPASFISSVRRHLARALAELPEEAAVPAVDRARRAIVYAQGCISQVEAEARRLVE
jgi:hypothetical protein